MGKGSPTPKKAQNKRYDRIIGLITDFGNEDYYVGVLKGVIKKINPAVEIIDIANDIPSYEIPSASFIIDKTFRFFPGNTIFLVVVDPGGGTSRPLLLAQRAGQYFIAPDNGVLTPILQMPGTYISEFCNEDYFLLRGHSTFEARDKMAPAAAYLAAGVDPGKMTSPVHSYKAAPTYYPQSFGDIIEGRIAYIDKFGNIITNVTADFLFTALKESRKKNFKTIIKDKEITGFFKTYAESGCEPFMLIGSHDNLEIAINRNSAASCFDAFISQPLTIEFF
ncbi:MAG: SAM-dependent chlorinase/fluorinase [Candidatus Aminicenantes bacterium]|nr:SAM-dependent chlorinase/fluorinase [Candidatus Aminicenantes bacterium]